MYNKAFTACTLIICSIFIASSIYVMIPLQPALASLHETSIAYVSLSSTLFVLFYAFGLLVFGSLAEKFPHRTILLSGMGMLCIVTWLLSSVSSLEHVIILRIFQGFFAASFAPVTFSYCLIIFQGKLHSCVIAMINTGFLFAGVFGQIVSVFFASLYSYQAVFIAFGCSYLLCFILLSWTLQPTVNHSSLNNQWLSTILSCFRHQTLRKLYTIAVFLLFTVMLFYGSFEIYIYEAWRTFPFSVQAFRIISLLGIVPAFFASRLIERFGAKKVMLFQFGLMVVGFSPAIVVLNVVTVLVSSLAMIASTSLTIPLVVLLVGKHAPVGRAIAVAIYSFMLLIGASFGSTFAAYVSFPHVLVLICTLFILLSLFARLLPSD
ncbi:MFS transporter [Radiobacillus sp. PE A8.2]|uniref:MFS transporter n=1 Tax=Radiobacillus sp. PE A8.2 TaxID=3380349 RepID=UPI00388F8115